MYQKINKSILNALYGNGASTVFKIEDFDAVVVIQSLYYCFIIPSKEFLFREKVFTVKKHPAIERMLLERSNPDNTFITLKRTMTYRKNSKKTFIGFDNEGTNVYLDNDFIVKFGKIENLEFCQAQGRYSTAIYVHDYKTSTLLGVIMPCNPNFERGDDTYESE